MIMPKAMTVTPMMIMYACTVHFAEAVVRACRRANIVLIMAPTRMTWLLQLCDTHAFHRFNMVLRYMLIAARVATISGRLETYSL